MYPDSTESTPLRSSNTASRHQKQPPARVASSFSASVISFCLFLRLACYFVGSRPTTLQYAGIRFAAKPGAHRLRTPLRKRHESPTQPARRSTPRPRARLPRPATRSRAGGRHICGRLFLVHGTALRRLTGRHLHDLRLHGGNQEKSQLRGGLFGDHGARGSRAGRVRSEEGELRKAPRGVLEKRRPYRARPAVLRHRKPVPHCDLLSQRRAETSRRGLQRNAREDETVQGRYCHTCRAGRRVLARRGLSPGFLRQESGEVQVLPNRLRTRCQAEAVVGERSALTRIAVTRRLRS